METTNDLQEEFKRIISKNRLLIKFGNKKNLESLQDGCLYMKNLKCEVKNIVKMIKIFYTMFQNKSGG